MEEKKMVDVRKERERFLADPLLSTLNDQLVRIHMTAMPVYVIADNKIIEKKYNPETQALIENIERTREEYIEAKYGISEGNKKWR